MEAIEIARKLAALGSTEDACDAYSLVIHQKEDPAAELEAAAYILQSGGNYKVSYTCFLDLYQRGHFREEIFPLVTKVFYEPNIKMMQGRYERNCKLLKKYPYLFRKDFLPFEELPIRFYPYDDSHGYVPFYREQQTFGDYVNFKNPVISRNFFKDLENPVLAEDVTSQYELEYLRDNVRKSEYVGRENHVYLHYTDWSVFCSYLQCLNMRPLLEEEKLVFLIEDERSLYPIDFKARFGIDYSQYSIKLVGIQEITRLIWHTQLSTHNGGDFFNEVFDNHPNLLVLPSIMMSNAVENVKVLRDTLASAGSVKQAIQVFKEWADPQHAEEIYRMKNRTDKDFMVLMYLQNKMATAGLDPASRIVPAVFFQPHFSNIMYSLGIEEHTGRTILDAPNYEEIRNSSLFKNFKYIKTFTPMRRFTTSHGGTVKFMDAMAKQSVKDHAEGKRKTTAVVSDAMSERIFNRSFMIDPEDRLYKDSILVRFEDGKLNPRATFTALAAFLDLPYTESMTYCSEGGEASGYSKVYANGFDPAAVYRTYDEYVNDSERYFLEFFLRDAYEYYGYSFQYYDNAPMDEHRVAELIDKFETIDYYMRESWKAVFSTTKLSAGNRELSPEAEQKVRDQLLEKYMNSIKENRRENANMLLRGLRFVNKNGQPLRMMPMLQPTPELLENPIYH